MSDFEQSLFGTFGKRPKEPEKPIAPPAPPKPQLPEPDLWTAAEAQRIFTPNAPPAIKPPPAQKADSGTSGALDTTGAWGQPEAR